MGIFNITAEKRLIVVGGAYELRLRVKQKQFVLRMEVQSMLQDICLRDRGAKRVTRYSTSQQTSERIWH